jgi:hypothetical protein
MSLVDQVVASFESAPEFALGVKRSRIAGFDRHGPGRAPDGREVREPFHTARFDIVLARDWARSARTWSNRR